MYRLLFAAAAVILAAGCISAPQPEVPELVTFDGKNDAAAYAAAEKFARGMEQAIITGKFEPLDKVLPNSQPRMTAEHFAKLHKSMTGVYGKLQKLQFIVMLDQTRVRDYLWRMTFIQTPQVKNGTPAKPGKPVKLEILLHVRIYQENGKVPAVGGFSFKVF